jgi:hypothetical protein
MGQGQKAELLVALHAFKKAKRVMIQGPVILVLDCEAVIASYKIQGQDPVRP